MSQRGVETLSEMHSDNKLMTYVTQPESAACKVIVIVQNPLFGSVSLRYLPGIEQTRTEMPAGDAPRQAFHDFTEKQRFSKVFLGFLLKELLTTNTL